MAQQQGGKLPARSPRGFSPTDGTKAMPFTPRQVNELGMAIPLGQGPVGGPDSKLKSLIKGTVARRTSLPVPPQAQLGNNEQARPIVLRIVGDGPDGRQEVAEIEFPAGTSNIQVERIQ